ncbi:hypothetical protein ACSNOK_14970 [Streptomyces sp. URMC 126]|uniref:hypothetical protein n=1 Tax=Streptomyces sp. URMC 126 TaxID=3423401 RepID=UPI003F1CED52
MPVICMAAAGEGVGALQTAVMAVEAEGLPPARMAAVAALGDGRLPRPVKATTTMLQGELAARVNVSFDERIRSHGLRDTSRLKSRTTAAGSQLAAAVL